MFLRKLYKNVNSAKKRQLRKELPFVSFRSDEVYAAFTRVGVHIRIRLYEHHRFVGEKVLWGQ